MVDLEHTEGTASAVPYIGLDWMRAVLGRLAGSITFVDGTYDGDGGTDISLALDGSVTAVVDGDDATVYCRGACLPADCGKAFEGFAARRMDLRGLDAGRVTDMCGMFGSCTSLAGLDLSGWDVGAAAGMEGMFRGCVGLAELRVKDGTALDRFGSAGGLFGDCPRLAGIDVEDWAGPA